MMRVEVCRPGGPEDAGTVGVRRVALDQPKGGRAHDLPRRVGRRVRALRRARGLSQTEVEARLFNFKYLQRIEAGQVNVTLHTIGRLADLLDADVAELFRD